MVQGSDTTGVLTAAPEQGKMGLSVNWTEFTEVPMAEPPDNSRAAAVWTVGTFLSHVNPEPQSIGRP
jgi:hypothetical protein